MPHHAFVRRARRLWLVALVWSCSGAWAAEVAGRAFLLEAVAEGVLVHLGRHEDASVSNAADIANLSVVIGERSIALIDPGGSRAVGEALLAAVREHSTLPISHLVFSHAHPDHVFGAGVFAEVPEVIAHRRFERAWLARRASDLARLGTLSPASASPMPTLTLAAGAEHAIDLGGRRLRLLALPPAHTDHDLMVLDETSGTLFAGDVVVGQRTPSLDGDLLGWIDALEAIGSMASQRIVPGHGRPAAPDALLGPLSAYLRTLRDAVRTAIARGESMASAVSRAEGGRFAELPHDRDGWRLYALHHPFNVTRAWSQLEWE